MLMRQLISLVNIMRAVHKVIPGVSYLLILLTASCLAQVLRRVGLIAMYFINSSRTSSYLNVIYIHS